jgi:hypothetical protein
MQCSPYLSAPLRTEEQASDARQVITERTELYEQMLGYDEARAEYVARGSWEQRLGHYHSSAGEGETWAPLPHDQDVIVAATLFPGVSSEFWFSAADHLCDWIAILDDLIDSAATQRDRDRATYERGLLQQRIERARQFGRKLRAAADRGRKV